MLYLGKYSNSFFFIAKCFGNFWIVKQFFEYKIYNPLANLKTNLAESFSVPLEDFFSNNINIKVIIDPLFDNFGGNGIIFLFFSNLKNSNRLSSKVIYYILYFIFFEHSLRKVDILRPILKVFELFLSTLLFIIIICYWSNKK